MVGVIQTRRIRKMRVRAADCFRLFIHHFRESGIGTGDILRECIGTVVCGMQEQTVKAVSDAQFVSCCSGNDSGILFQIILCCGS